MKFKIFKRKADSVKAQITLYNDGRCAIDATLIDIAGIYKACKFLLDESGMPDEAMERIGVSRFKHE